MELNMTKNICYEFNPFRVEDSGDFFTALHTLLSAFHAELFIFNPSDCVNQLKEVVQ